MSTYGVNSDLRSRILDFESRLARLNTVTNTQSAQVSGGETVVDAEGGLIFSDGGRMNTTSLSTGGVDIVSSSGVLDVDLISISGDILSSSDYMNQREAFHFVIVDEIPYGDIDSTIPVSLPDWASKAYMSVSVQVKARMYGKESSSVTFSIGGFPLSRTTVTPGTDAVLSTTTAFITDTSYPVSIEFIDSVAPSPEARVRVEVGGVYLP